MTDASRDALQRALLRALGLFRHHAEMAAEQQGALDNPANWRRRWAPDADADKIRLQKARAEAYAQAVRYRDEYNDIKSDMEPTP